MKKLILFSLICLLSIATRAQDSGLKGAWTGKLNVYGNELTLVFHFNGEDCTLDSPDQGVKGVPAKLERTVTGIKGAVPSINSSYPSTTQYNLPTSLAQNLAVVTKQLQTPYMKHFLALDSRPLLGNITCPVLALNGSKDTQVDSESNLDALRSGLQKNAKNKLEAIEGVNHLFQHCKTGMATEYGNIEETIAPEVLETMVYWLSNL